MGSSARLIACVSARLWPHWPSGVPGPLGPAWHRTGAYQRPRWRCSNGGPPADSIPAWALGSSTSSNADGFSVEGSALSWSSEKDPTAVPWSDRGVEMKLKQAARSKRWRPSTPISNRWSKRVVVFVREGVVAGEEALNIVYGINHHLYEPARHQLRRLPPAPPTAWRR